MDSYELITIIIVITAVFAYVNFRFIRLPSTVGLMVMSLILSIFIVLFGRFFPTFSEQIKTAVATIDFQKLLLDIMLSFLLFAGAIHIDAQRLRKNRISIIILASVGMLLSTAIVGTLLYLLLAAFHHPVGLIYCLLFGALISPTDPVAVLGILQKANIPESAEMKITGESLFNDGVAIVIFLTLLHIAQTGIEDVSAANVLSLFLEEVGGGLIYGAVLGYVFFLLLKSVNNYEVEVLLTIAMVMGGYMLAQVLHLSAPIAIVTAGIIMGNKGRQNEGMSSATRAYLSKFWEMIDNILNAILFLLIGFEMLVVDINATLIIIGCITFLIVLLARFLSVLLPFAVLRIFTNFEKHTVTILTLGALRGGISVAIALSLPPNMYRDQFVTITYIVVVFSIIGQGLTIGKLLKRLQKN